MQQSNQWKQIHGMSQIIDQYDAFIFDVWGCLFDGHKLFQGTIEVLQQIKAKNKTSVILSNSHRMKEALNTFLQELGIPRHLYLEAHSSGQQLRMFFENRSAIEKQTKMYVEDPKLLKIIQQSIKNDSVVFSDQLQDCDIYIWSLEFEEDQAQIDKRLKDLEICKQQQIELVIPTPDKYTFEGQKRFICPGYFGQIYQNQYSGKVRYFGKPYEEVYQTVFQQYLDGVDKTRILMIGDSLHSDIKGAQNNGIDSLLLLSGLHQDISIDDGQTLQLEGQKYESCATFVMKELKL